LSKVVAKRETKDVSSLLFICTRAQAESAEIANKVSKKRDKKGAGGCLWAISPRAPCVCMHISAPPPTERVFRFSCVHKKRRSPARKHTIALFVLGSAGSFRPRPNNWQMSYGAGSKIAERIKAGNYAARIPRGHTKENATHCTRDEFLECNARRISGL
jgi:hypothetical protein